MTGAPNFGGIGKGPAAYPVKCCLMFAATLLILHGCGNVPSEGQAVGASRTTASSNVEAETAPLLAPKGMVEVSGLAMFKVVDGQTSPLADTKLGPTESLRLMVELAGDSEQTDLEIRVGDVAGNGVFRDTKTLKVKGKASATFNIPAPADGWKAGTYLVTPMVDHIPSSASSFLVR